MTRHPRTLRSDLVPPVASPLTVITNGREYIQMPAVTRRMLDRDSKTPEPSGSGAWRLQFSRNDVSVNPSSTRSSTSVVSKWWR